MVFDHEQPTASTEEAPIKMIYDQLFEATGTLLNINSLNDDEYTATQIEHLVETLQVILSNLDTQVFIEDCQNMNCSRCGKDIMSGEPYTTTNGYKLHFKCKTEDN